jgi:hypothetical protein
MSESSVQFIQRSRFIQRFADRMGKHVQTHAVELAEVEGLAGLPIEGAARSLSGSCMDVGVRVADVLVAHMSRAGSVVPHRVMHDQAKFLLR